MAEGQLLMTQVDRDRLGVGGALPHFPYSKKAEDRGPLRKRNITYAKLRE